MEKNHHQDRQGAEARNLQRAHAHRLLVTLAGICRHLCRQQSCPAARKAYRRVEQELLGPLGRPRKPALARPTEQGES